MTRGRFSEEGKKVCHWGHNISFSTYLVGAGGKVEQVIVGWVFAVRMSGRRSEVETLALHPQPELGSLAAGRFRGARGARDRPGGRPHGAARVLLGGPEECNDSGVLAGGDGLGLGRVAISVHDPRRVIVEHQLSGRGHGEGLAGRDLGGVGAVGHQDVAGRGGICDYGGRWGGGRDPGVVLVVGRDNDGTVVSILVDSDDLVVVRGHGAVGVGGQARGRCSRQGFRH